MQKMKGESICKKFVYNAKLVGYANKKFGYSMLSVMPCHKLGGMGYE